MRTKRALYAVLAVAVIGSLLAVATGVFTPKPGPTPAPTGAVPTPSRPVMPQDSVASIIIQRTPASGEELPPDGTVEVVFARAMDRASTEGAFHLAAYTGGATVAGTYAWPDSRTMQFRPAAPLPRGGVYRAYLDKNAMDEKKQPVGDASAFAVLVTGYLEVAQVLPAPDAKDVDPTGAITVIFNRPVVPLTTLAEQEALPKPLTISPAVPGKGEWLNTAIYRFTPERPLDGGTTYTARVAAGLIDTVGTPLEQEYAWTFSTQPPVVSWTSPNDGGLQISPSAPLTVTFNQPIDGASAAQAFTLSNANGNRVEVQTGANGAVLIITPAARLDFDTTYIATLAAGVRSATGGEGMRQSVTWRFTTAPLPSIVATYPRDGEQSADAYSGFTIQFSSALINPDTVMPNLTFTPPLSPTQVYTYFSPYDQRFVVGFPGEPSTDYTVQIGPDIADVFGNKTGQAMTVKYRTAPLAPAAQLLMPDVIGAFNGYDPARLVVAHVNVTRLDLRLLRLDVKDLSRLYDYAWSDTLPPGVEVRNWSLAIESTLNKPGYTSVDLVDGGGALEPGLYFLQLNAPEIKEQYNYGRRLMLVVSTVNLTLKREDNVLFAWATDLRSGAPVAGLALEAVDPNVGTRVSATTDAQGVARFDLPVNYNYGRSGNIYVLSAAGEPRFTGASEGWINGISPWDFNLPGGWGLQAYMLHVVTDRPIYRPDQKVYFRGILRADDDARYSLPSGVENVQVTVNAPDGSTVYQGPLPLSTYGTFNGEFALSPGAALGDYYISVTFRDPQGREQGFGANFTVAAYRAPEFSVTVTPAARDIVSGTATSAAVSVAYYFGGPVANQNVEWNVIADTYYFDLPGAGGYSFTDGADPYLYFGCWGWLDSPCYDRYGGTPVLQGSGVTDAQGRFTIELPSDLMAKAGASGSMQFTVEAVIYGADGQVISGRDSFTMHRADLYVGVRTNEYVARAGQQTSIDVITVGWDGARRAGQAVAIDFVRVEWINEFKENTTGQGGTWSWTEKETLIATANVVTNGLGEAAAQFTPDQGGSYRVRARAADAGGREARSSTYLWVIGNELVSWRRDNNNRLTLVSDKQSYLPGETAQILVPSPFQGKQYAWVTIERGHVLKQEVLSFEGSTLLYQVPITAGYAPNVYVSVVLVKGQDDTNKFADFKVGYAALEVETQAQALSVEVRPRAGKLQPGETATFDIVVRDGNGQPVQGEFSFDLVDKAVLSLMPRVENAVLKTFYGPRALNVTTASGLTMSVNRMVEQQMVQLESAGSKGAPGGATNGTGQNELPPAMPAATPAPAAEGQARDAYSTVPAGVEIRENFADTAYWTPSLVTDAAGQATVEIKLPDNLTTWVLRGVGITADTKAGEGVGEVMATRPLMIRPVTPRFFVVDDRVQLAALVSNTTDKPLDAQVSLIVEGLAIANDLAAQTVTVPANGEAKVTWEVTAQDAAYASLIFTAVSGEYTDAAKPRLATGPEGTIPVLRYTTPDIIGTAGYLDAAGNRTEIIALPPRFDDRRGSLDIRIDPSLAAGMTEGLSYLEHFEYECTEQTVSRFLPNVLTYKALRDLGIKDADLEARLPALVQEGLDKLYNQQHGDGGWGWWSSEREESNPYLSAYVVFGLLKAQAAGFTVRDDVLQRGIDYVRGSLVMARELNNTYTANRQAFMVYVLAEAGRVEASRLSDLYDHRDKLGRFGQAYLAMAIGIGDAKDTRVATLLSDLSGAAIVSATGTHWEEDAVDWWAMNTNTRSTAVILDAFARLDPKNQLVPNAVRWLMVARKAGIWSTTQETAWALIGLTDWMVATGELAANYDYVVQLNDAQIAQGNVTTDNVRQSVKLNVAITDLLKDVGNTLVFAHGTGNGVLYYTAHLKVYQAVPDVKAASRGITVLRRYVSADCTDGTKCPAITSAKVGDVIRVEITLVAPHDLYYVMLEDPLPAGGEAIDPTLATTSQLAAAPGLSSTDCSSRWGWCWWWNWWSRSEMRDDKVVLFANYLSSGTYQYTYTFRATLPGEYRVIPSVAQEMYFPEVFGRTDGALFTINP